jgi:hypothetical protein
MAFRADRLVIIEITLDAIAAIVCKVENPEELWSAQNALVWIASCAR